MKNKKTRFLACLLCVSVLLSTGYFSGGFGALADAIHKWTNKAEDLVSKDTSFELGSKENPMLILEIVPSPELAQIG